MDKFILKIVIIVLFLTVYSCSKTLKPDIPDTPKLSVFSLLEPSKPVVVSLSYSLPVLEKDVSRSYVEEATIIMFENDLSVDTLVRVDSFLFLSKILPQTNKNYRFDIQVPETDKVSTENVKILNVPKIIGFEVDSINKTNDKSDQDFIKATGFFDQIKGYKYMAYTIETYIKGETKGGRTWNTVSDYQCGGDELTGIDDVSLAYIGCIESIDKIQFDTRNYNFEEIDSVKFKICKVSNLTGDYLNIAKLSGFVLVAPDDNAPSNVAGGYGAILSLSCSEKVIVIK